jgi:hypothetical protein
VSDPIADGVVHSARNGQLRATEMLKLADRQLVSTRAPVVVRLVSDSALAESSGPPATQQPSRRDDQPVQPITLAQRTPGDRLFSDEQTENQLNQNVAVGPRTQVQQPAGIPGQVDPLSWDVDRYGPSATKSTGTIPYTRKPGPFWSEWGRENTSKTNVAIIVNGRKFILGPGKWVYGGGPSTVVMQPVGK